jgi:hypothetical protein
MCSNVLVKGVVAIEMLALQGQHNCVTVIQRQAKSSNNAQQQFKQECIAGDSVKPNPLGVCASAVAAAAGCFTPQHHLHAPSQAM